ncbi:MAG TPA: XRE family transcriptional regulator [candidate division WOR-3 bacterium]|uniref:XRE family transcriptional regulator n=1 Tax=candidate division WOR-3 bacterium TaxID=2052148 RepID=A0A7V0XEY3_UNCW3|nr:XRE family transcriptional regulator [candidate division WOR-3 bacterium]
MSGIERDRWYDETRGKFEQDPAYQVECLKLVFGEDVGRLMEERGINQAELARRLGVSRAYVTRLFHGTFNPTVETLAKVALALGARVELRLVSKDEGAPKGGPRKVRARPGPRRQADAFVAADRPRPGRDISG